MPHIRICNMCYICVQLYAYVKLYAYVTVTYVYKCHMSNLTRMAQSLIRYDNSNMRANLGLHCSHVSNDFPMTWFINERVYAYSRFPLSEQKIMSVKVYQ